MATAPSGATIASPTSGRLRAGSSISRTISVTDGRSGSSANDWVRMVATLETPGTPRSDCANVGAKCAPPPPRRYRSAGSTTSSQCVTDSRKLATMTVSATARLSEATIPLTATAALSRTRRARSMASVGSSQRDSRGARRS